MPAITANRSPFTRPDVDRAVGTVQPDVDGLREIDRDVEVAGEEVAGTGREDGEDHGRVADRVDAALHDAVAAPDEDQVGTAVDRLADAVGGELALGDLEPGRVFEAGVGEHAPQLHQAPAELLAGVRDHCDRGHRATSWTNRIDGAVAVGSVSSLRWCAPRPARRGRRRSRP